MSTDVGGGIRKASPEALSLMMKNIKANNKQKTSAWVPSGVTSKKENNNGNNAKKIFFWASFHFAFEDLYYRLVEDYL